MLTNSHLKLYPYLRLLSVLNWFCTGGFLSGRVFKAQSYRLCSGACGWGHSCFRLICHLIGQSVSMFLFSISLFSLRYALKVLPPIPQYLEEKYPQHPLLPQHLHKKAINFQVKLLSYFYVAFPLFSFQI